METSGLFSGDIVMGDNDHTENQERNVDIENDQKVLSFAGNKIVVKWPCKITINGMAVAVRNGMDIEGFYFLDPWKPSEELYGIDFGDNLEMQVFVQNECKIVMSGTCKITPNHDICLELKNHTPTPMRSWYSTVNYGKSKESQKMNDITRQPFITFQMVNSNEKCRRIYAMIVQTESEIGMSSKSVEYIKLTTTYDEIQCVDLPSRERVTYKIFELNQAGNFYKVANGTSEENFLTHNTINDVMELKRMAETFIEGSGTMPVLCLFRNKPSSHTTIIESKMTNIIKKYIKDNNGDQASSINKQIDGLFFSATSDRLTHQPPPYSPFGNYRIIIPPDLLFYVEKRSDQSDPIRRNLYFADFYCKPPRSRRRGRNIISIATPHYVTLVLTTPGSKEDRYCKNRLVQLDIQQNKFLYFNARSQIYETIENDDLNVEVLFTEDIDLKFMRSQSGFREDENVKSKGQSSPQGIPKYSKCSKCNLPKKIRYI